MILWPHGTRFFCGSSGEKARVPLGGMEALSSCSELRTTMLHSPMYGTRFGIVMRRVNVGAEKSVPTCKCK